MIINKKSKRYILNSFYIVLSTVLLIFVLTQITGYSIIMEDFDKGRVEPFELTIVNEDIEYDKVENDDDILINYFSDNNAYNRNNDYDEYFITSKDNRFYRNNELNSINYIGKVVYNS